MTTPSLAPPGALTQEPAAQVVAVSKTYGRGNSAVPALRNVTAAFRPGTFTAIMGPSGSGKSTLLHLSAGLDRPTSGDVRIGSTDLSQLSEKQLTLAAAGPGRLHLPGLQPPSGTQRRAEHRAPCSAGRQACGPGLAGRSGWRVGLAALLKRRPAELSGGQQQRVAIARALVMRPEVVFADEPTGALDSRTGAEILSLLREGVDNRALTIVMVTHDPVAAAYADNVFFLADGRIVDHLSSPTAELVADRMTHLEG